MMRFRSSQLVTGAFMVLALAVPMLTNGCSAVSDAAKGACCTEFQAGADMGKVDFGVNADIKAQFNSFAQAAGDFSGAATGALSDVENACRNIAQDLGATAAQRDEAEALPQRDRAAKWCSFAVAQIKGNAALKAAGSLSVKVTPAVCSASISAKGSCQAKCDVSGKCDIKANPPVCTGGKLEVACKGECTAKAGASLSCTGECTGSCSGSCEAKGGVAVDCDGKCEGTCTAGGAANGSGIQADGSCKGTCSGKCAIRAEAPAVTCKGTCSGSCSASCKGTAEASVKCDGECKADFEPLQCEGGKLEGGCKVDATCDANCNASVSAKAECTPPAITIAASGAASLTGDVAAQYNAAIDSLKVNLPNLLVVFKARGQAFVDLGQAVVSGGAKITASADKLGAKGAICGTIIAGTIGESVSNATASLQAAGSVVTAIGVN